MGLMIEVITDQSILTKISEPCMVQSEIDRVKELLISTVKSLHGCAAGLAAIQLGIPYRIFVVNLWGDHVMTFVNPELSLLGLPFWSEEGCLSLPGQKFIVQRYPQIICKQSVCKSTDLSVRFNDVSYFNTLAVTIQHEYDHINGITLLQKKWKD